MKADSLWTTIAHKEILQNGGKGSETTQRKIFVASPTQKIGHKLNIYKLHVNKCI